MNIAAMTREECLRLHGELSEQSSRIKTQIQQAKANVVARGEYSDPDWFVSATVAQRITGRKLQQIQARLSVLNSERRAENIRTMGPVVMGGHLAFLHAFYRLAKATMHPGDFEQMCKESQELGPQRCDQCRPTPTIPTKTESDE